MEYKTLEKIKRLKMYASIDEIESTYREFPEKEKLYLLEKIYDGLIKNTGIQKDEPEWEECIRKLGGWNDQELAILSNNPSSSLLIAEIAERKKIECQEKMRERELREIQEIKRK